MIYCLAGPGKPKQAISWQSLALVYKGIAAITNHWGFVLINRPDFDFALLREGDNSHLSVADNTRRAGKHVSTSGQEVY